MRRPSVLAALLVAALHAGGALADGTHFFMPTADGKALDPNALIYTGNIKDQNGRYVADARVFVRFTDQGASFPARLDRPGHYITPDLHALAKITGKPLRPEAVTLEIDKPGHTLARPPAIPKRDKGVFSIDLLVAPTAKR